MRHATAIALLISIGLTIISSAFLTILTLTLLPGLPFSPTPTTHPFALWLTLLLLLLLTCQAASRLFLSPLSHIPGPKIVAFTQVYEFYFDIVLGGRYTWEIERLHKKYGPIIRISPYELHISDPEFIGEVYGNGKIRDRWKWALGMFGIDSGMLTTSEHELHRRRRTPLNPLFSRKAVQEFEGRMKEFVDKMCERVKKGPGVVNLDLVFAACTLDLVSEYCFGGAYGALERGDLYQDVTVGMLEASQALHFNKFFPWVMRVLKNLPDRVVKWSNPKMEELLVLQKRWASDSRRMLNDSSPKTTHFGAFHTMLNSQAFLPFDRNVPHLIATAQNIIGPGTTTTAAFLTRTTFHILNNPRILSNLKAELNAAIPDPAMIPSSPDLEKLPYLTAVIHEGHRISHGVSHRLQRVAREPIIYKTWIIPAGTPVGMTPSIMAMNEDVFPNPKIFDPDRYLDTSGMVRRRKAAFNPFGKGPRSCLGINLATAEAYIILAMMFRRFDFELFETKREDVDVARDYFAALPKVGARGLRVLVRSSE